MANPGFSFGNGGGAAPVVVSSGFDFTVGQQITIEWISGFVQANSGFPPADANGQTTSSFKNDANAYPSVHTPLDWDTFVMALMGTFADSGGVIVGTPFEIGNLRTVDVPAGATQLQLGINDDNFGDNLGGFVLNVSQVPEPGGLSLLVVAGAMALGRRRAWR